MFAAYFPHAARDYEAKSVLDSYESAGIDNDVSEPLGYEQQLAARRMAEEAMEADDGRRRGRKRGLPGALEGELFVGVGLVFWGGGGHA